MKLFLQPLRPEALSVQIPLAAGLRKLAVVLVFSVVSAFAGTIHVPAGGNFQAALNSAQPGDVITLSAGDTFTGPFTLPCNFGSSYITIRTSAPDHQLPPAGSRINPDYAGILPKLVAGEGAPVISTQACSNHFQFLGLEIKPASGTRLFALVELGTARETSVSQLPSGFVFDRVYLRGDPTIGTRRGIAMNAPHVTVKNSYLADFKEAGADSQALAAWNSPGPLTITNNFLEGAGENILIGGVDPSIPNLVPTDITIRNNHFSKPWSWRGSSWTVKNLFELKNAKQVVVDGNLFENNWAAAQAGFAILFTVRNQDGTAPWSVVSDVQFTNNIVRHTASGINILGSDDIFSSQQTYNITARNNLFEDISSANYGGTGRLFQVLNGGLNITFDHNTSFSDGAVMMADQLPSSGLVFTNNMVTRGAQGFHGTGTSEGIGTLNHYFPGAIFLANAIIGANSSLHPTGNFFPAIIEDVNFVDRANGNYSLGANSPGRNAGTDGADVGVNMATLNAAQHGSSGTTPPAVSTRSLPDGPQNRLYSATLAATGGTTPYTWSLASGTLPAGLTFGSGTGVISGTPRGAGTSSFTVRVSDANSQTSSKALSIAIDAGVPGGGLGEGDVASSTRTQEDNPAVGYTGPWFPIRRSFFDSGAATASADAGSRAVFSFTGVAVRWIGYRDEWSGKANVYLDGQLRTTVDTYSSPAQAQAVIWEASGLPSGRHTLTIEATGTRHAASGGGWVWIDGFELYVSSTSGGTTPGIFAAFQ